MLAVGLLVKKVYRALILMVSPWGFINTYIDSEN